MKLTTDNTSAFWTSAWDTNVTGWRNAEATPSFTRHLYAFACHVPGGAAAPATAVVPPLPLVVTAEMHAAEELNGPAEEATVRGFLAGKTVLVPLCGDTAVLRYMADHGAAAVIGADLAVEGLRLQREVRFAGVTFTFTTHALPGAGDASSVVVYEGCLGGSTVRLFEGDFLELPRLSAFAAAPVDFVYDRASMMAMHPSLRAPYVRSIASVLRPDAGLMVERPVRDEGDARGPPFTFSADEVLSLYEAATGRPYEICTLLENRWFSRPATGSVHYLEFFRLYPRAAAV